MPSSKQVGYKYKNFLQPRLRTGGLSKTEQNMIYYSNGKYFIQLKDAIVLPLAFNS